MERKQFALLPVLSVNQMKTRSYGLFVYLFLSNPPGIQDLGDTS